MDVDHKAALVGELLQLKLPQPHARAFRAAAVGGDGQFVGMRITPTPHAIEPGSDRLDRERGGVGGGLDADPALVGGHVIDPYVAKFAEAVFVLRCFEKTSQRTSRLDIDPATRRYRELVMELKG